MFQLNTFVHCAHLCAVRTAIEARGYLAEAALWVMAWRHQGQLQALVESRTLMVSTDNLFKVLQGYANSSSTSWSWCWSCVFCQESVDETMIKRYQAPQLAFMSFCCWSWAPVLHCVVHSVNVVRENSDVALAARLHRWGMANTIVYARCFVQELNKNAQLCKQVTDLPFSLLPKGSEGRGVSKLENFMKKNAALQCFDIPAFHSQTSSAMRCTSCTVNTCHICHFKIHLVDPCCSSLE